MATRKRSDRKPYQPPRLKVHGDLRRLTMGPSKGGAKQDGGTTPKTKAGSG